MLGRQPGRCRCVYDNPSKSVRRKQGNLNKTVEQEWQQINNARAKKSYELYRQRQSGQPYQAPPPPVNVFNEAMFLRPIA
jgi:hypothetical protein